MTIGCAARPTSRLGSGPRGIGRCGWPVLLVLRDRLLEQVVAQIPEPRIHADAEGVREPQFAANDVHAGHAQAAVAAHVDVHVGPDGPQSPHQVPQVIVHSQGCLAGAVSQADQEHHVVLGAGDDDRQILILIIVSMKHDQLLLAMRGVVEGVDVEREMAWRLIERLDEQVDQHVAQPPQVGDRDSVLEPRERRLAGEVGVVGQAVGDELEDGVRPQRVVVVLILVVGQDAVDPLPNHGQQRVLDEGGIPPVLEGGGELLGEPDPLVELADRQQPGVTRERGGRKLDLDRPRGEEIE